MLDAEAAARLIREHWDAGTQIRELPEDLRPANREQGYQVQAHLSESAVVGWKIAATSVEGQRHINVSGPIAGRLFSERVHEDGAEVSLGAYHMAVAEAEFAFRMGRDLAPRPEAYSEAEALAAVESLHPAIELPDSRFDDFTAVGEAQLIADNACAHEFVLGPATDTDWRAIDLAAYEVTGAAGETVHQGLGSRVLGGPGIALAWLVNELSGLGLTLEAGQVVTTGTCITPLSVRRGDRVSADFGPLGLVLATLA